MSEERNTRKVRQGVVVSAANDKTIVVSVERLARHRLYKRVIRLSTKFKAHDETNDARIGDTVGVRDTKAHGNGPVLKFNEREWCAFLDGVANGEFT